MIQMGNPPVNTYMLAYAVEPPVSSVLLPRFARVVPFARCKSGGAVMSGATGGAPAATAVPGPEDWLRAIAEREDRAAFASLFRAFAPRIKGYMMRLGCSAAQAEDLVQETFVGVWRKARLYDPAKAAAATWIFTVARNLRIDLLRRERRPEIDPDDPALVGDAAPLPDAELSGKQQAARVRAALATLPAEQVSVVELSFFAGKAHGAIAEELDIPLGTVKSRLRLAFRRIRSALDGNS